MTVRMSLTDWKREWGGDAVQSHKSTTSGGVDILFSKNFAPVCFQVEQVVEGRLMVVSATFEHFNIIFVNMYAPTTGPERALSPVLSEVNVEDFYF